MHIQTFLNFDILIKTTNIIYFFIIGQKTFISILHITYMCIKFIDTSSVKTLRIYIKYRNYYNTDLYN